MMAAAAHAVTDEDEPDRRVLGLTGQETVRIPATRARLTIVVEEEAKNAAPAQQAVSQRSNAVLDFLQRSDVDRLQAGTLSLHPIYEETSSRGPRHPTTIAGYRAQWTASFEIEADRTGKIADGVVSAGAARIRNFEFTATEAALADAQRQALREAALRAREDAPAVLQALGYAPDEVVRITVNTGGPIRPLAQRAEMTATRALDQGKATTAVEPGFIEVDGSVTLEVAY